MGKMRIKKEAVGTDDRSTKSKLPRKAKRRLKSNSGAVYIKSSFNNTIINFVDDEGGTICWASAGSSGFKGTKKSTPYAASVIAANAANQAKECGLLKVKVFVKGIGSGRESAVRAIAAAGFEVISIKDQTPAPHNGCRAKKTRRT